METVFAQQYTLVRQSREVLLAYCATISDVDFTADNSSFGRGSIRNLLVHIANTYQFWIGKQALQKQTEFTSYPSIKNVNEVKTLFKGIDDLMFAFFIRLQSGGMQGEVECAINGQIIHASPLQLFSHVITHEFHHKGQILSLSRHLGYVPVDTDIMR